MTPFYIKLLCFIALWQYVLTLAWIGLDWIEQRVLFPHPRFELALKHRSNSFFNSSGEDCLTDIISLYRQAAKADIAG